jgi:hypothetical protein
MLRPTVGQRGECDETVALTVKAVHISESSVNVHQSTRCYNPEDSHL